MQSVIAHYLQVGYDYDKSGADPTKKQIIRTDLISKLPAVHAEMHVLVFSSSRVPSSQTATQFFPLLLL